MEVPARTKDICILEIDDIEDLEIISLILEPGAPEGFHVVNTQTVPGLLDLEVARNLQMFSQVWRAKFGNNQKVNTFPKHFIRLLQTIYFKLRSMIPCAICDLKFRLDLPESVRHNQIMRTMNESMFDVLFHFFERMSSKFLSQE